MQTIRALPLKLLLLFATLSLFAATPGVGMADDARVSCLPGMSFQTNDIHVSVGGDGDGFWAEVRQKAARSGASKIGSRMRFETTSHTPRLRHFEWDGGLHCPPTKCFEGEDRLRFGLHRDKVSAGGRCPRPASRLKRGCCRCQAGRTTCGEGADARASSNVRFHPAPHFHL